MKLYELTVIINSTLEDSVVQAEIETIEKQIESSGGKIHKLERWGVKRLTYSIKGFHQGFYVHFLFEASGPLISDLEKNMRINENVLRFLTVSAPVIPPREKKPGKEELEPSDEPSPVED
jgi:small subunit ribosomal protein S6